MDVQPSGLDLRHEGLIPCATAAVAGLVRATPPRRFFKLEGELTHQLFEPSIRMLEAGVAFRLLRDLKRLGAFARE
jgi:hypothetical protein